MRLFAPTTSITEPSPSSSLVGRVQHWLAQSENRLLLLLLLAAFPLYYELGRNPVQLWDESRLAVNAAEMAQHGHWMVPHFDGQPDHWNTKPPLLIWIEALCFKSFGLSAGVLRLPTLLATLATVLLLFRFAGRVLGRPVAGLLAVMVLVTSAGYLRLHVARTGDYDALLVFWQVLLWTQFFQYLETGVHRHLWWAGAALLAATLTKGPAALLGLPGLLVYSIGRGRLGWLLRQPRVYAVAFSWVVVVVGYFVLRETVDPGYWQAVRANDLGGRFLTVLEGHENHWDFYLKEMSERNFVYWRWAVAPAVLVTGFLQQDGKVKRAVGLLTAFVVSWLLAISTAKTGLNWYEAPTYPALALLLGLAFDTLYHDFRSLYLSRLSRYGGWAAMLVLMLAVFYGPYAAIVQQLIGERHSDFSIGSDNLLGRYVHKLAHEQPDIRDVTLLTHGQNVQVLKYYKIEFEQVPGRHLATAAGDEARKMPVGKVVVLCDPVFRSPLDSLFNIVELHRDTPCQTLLLAPRKW